MDERREKATKPKSVRNVITNWISFGYAVVINLFLTPFIVHSLGDARYGIWVLLASLVGYMGLLDMGVRSAVMRFVAGLHAKGEDRDASEVASTGVAIFVVLGSAAVLLAVPFAWALPSLFTLDSAYVAEARVVLLLGGASVATTLVGGVFGGVISAMQRFDLQSLLGLVVNTLRALLIVLALSLGYGLIEMSVVQFFCASVRAGGSYFLARRLYPELRVRPSLAVRKRVRQIFSFAALSSVLHVTRSIVMSGSLVIIGIFLPVTAVTFFSIASSLISYTRTAIAAIAQTVTPRASALQSLGEGEELRAVFLRLAKVASLVVAPIAITFLTRGDTFIGVWMGEGYVSSAGAVLSILALSLVVTAPGRVMYSAMIGMNLQRLLIPFQLAEAALNIGLSLLLVREFGIVGVAWANAIPTLVVTAVSLPWVVNRAALGIPAHRLFFSVVFRPWFSMVPFALVSLAVDARWEANSVLIFFLQVAAILPIALVGAYAVGVDHQERSEIHDHLRRQFRPVR